MSPVFCDLGSIHVRCGASHSTLRTRETLNSVPNGTPKMAFMNRMTFWDLWCTPFIHHLYTIYIPFQTSLAAHGATSSKPRNQREHRLRPRPSHSRGCTKYPPWSDPMVVNSQFQGGAKNDTLDNFNTLTIILYICVYHILPVVPHKAVAEVSKIGNL